MWSQVTDALNQAAASVAAGFASMLPGTIALLLSLLIAALLGWLLAAVVRRALTGLGFDQRLASWGWDEVGRGPGARSPTLVVSRLAGGLVVLAGLLVGIAAFNPTLTSDLVGHVFGSAMNLVTAVLVVVVGGVLARFLARGVLISLVNMNFQHARLISLGVKWLMFVFSAAMALNHLSVGGRIVELAFGILFGGVVLTVALAIGLRSREFADWLLARRPSEEPRDERQPLDHL